MSKVLMAGMSALIVSVLLGPKSSPKVGRQRSIPTGNRSVRQRTGTRKPRYEHGPRKARWLY